MNMPRGYLYLITLSIRLLWDEIQNDWAKTSVDFGLTVTEDQVLWAVELLDVSTVTEVARQLQRDKGTISKSVYSLEENGLITRELGQDRRFYELQLTEPGRALRRTLSNEHFKGWALTESLGNLNFEERETLLLLLLKLVGGIYGDTYLLKTLSTLSNLDENSSRLVKEYVEQLYEGSHHSLGQRTRHENGGLKQ